MCVLIAGVAVGAFAMYLSPEVRVGKTLKLDTAFSATPRNVTYFMNGNSGGSGPWGTIDATGLYTAPAVVPATPHLKIQAINDAGKVLGEVTLTIVAAPGPPPPEGTPVPATMFGMHVHGMPVEYPTVTIGNMGKESAAQWGNIEHVAPRGAGCPGTVNCTHTYDWSVLDDYVNTAAAHGVQFQWTMDSGPPWATNSVGCNPGVWPQCTGPIVDLVDFDVFINALVTRYGAKIQTYELNNEADYSGTPQQMAVQFEHVVVGVLAVKPDAKFAAGMDFPVNQAGNTFHQVWAAWTAMPGNHARVDYAALHGYGNADALMLLGQCHTGTPSWQGRSVNGGQVDCVKQELAKMGLSATTPIWDTEGSWGSAGNGSLTIDQKEAYVATYYLIAWSLGVSRQEWYAWDNQGFGTLCAGNAPCVPNAAATAYAQTYAWMVGNVMTKRCASTGTVWTCELTRPDGTRTLAVWDVANASAFAVPAGYTRYADLTGNVAAVMNGTITLGVKPVLLEP